MLPPSSANRLSSTISTPSIVGAGPYDWVWKARFAEGVRSMKTPILRFGLDEAQQILPVRIVFHRARDPEHGIARDVAHAERDLLHARDHQPLPLLDRVDEVRRVEERRVGSRIEPGDSAAELLDLELAAPQIRGVHVGDLELAA